MKRVLLLLALLVVATPLFADRNQQVVPLNPKKIGHLGIPFIPADQPEVYYDNVTQVIIIGGTGDATYYDVDIFCCDDGLLVLQDTVNGSYDTIDVSSLPDGDYQIVITSSYDNEYEGYFIKD